MALAYTAPTWVNGSGTGISASQLQALSDCMEGLVQGSDKAITNIAISGQTITLTFADGSQEAGTASGLKGISSIAKTGTSGNVDTYTITYTDGSTSTFTVTNGADGSFYIVTAGIKSTDDPYGNIEYYIGGDFYKNGVLYNQSAFYKVTLVDETEYPPTPYLIDDSSGTFTNGHYSTGSIGGIPSGATITTQIFTDSTMTTLLSEVKVLIGLRGSEGEQGPQGPAGDDGVSPEVTITTITGGHRVNITDADHPSGQNFDVMDGQDGASDWSEITNKPNFATVATSGSYNDLGNKPSIPAAQVNSDWNAASGVAQILNKPTIPSITNCYQTTDTEETALANADYVPFYDISASAKRKISWSNIKSVLKTYFDTLYSKVVANPSGTATGTLTKLGIGSDIYEIQGGGGITKTITVYSAAVDTVTFTDLIGSKTVTTNASGVGTVSINYISGMVITFTSSVAKNPNNLSEDYSKVIQILEDTTTVYVMPNKNVLYWYGYKNNLESLTSERWGEAGYVNPTYNTNDVYFNGQCGVGVTNAISTKEAHLICKTTKQYHNIGIQFFAYTARYYAEGIECFSTSQSTLNTIEHIKISSNSLLGYPLARTPSTVDGGSNGYLYAMWYDDDDDDLLNDKVDKTDIAPVELSPQWKASQAYSIGQQFYLPDGKLYRAKAAIAQGATFTIGTNCELAGNVTEQLEKGNICNYDLSEYSAIVPNNQYNRISIIHGGKKIINNVCYFEFICKAIATESISGLQNIFETTNADVNGFPRPTIANSLPYFLCVPCDVIVSNENNYYMSNGVIAFTANYAYIGVNFESTGITANKTYIYIKGTYTI